MNVHESEKLAGMLEELSYVKTDDDELADVIVFNTCCIRENAEQKLVGNVGALKPLKEKKRNLIIAVGGCMTQQKNVGERLKETFPFIDIIFGTHNLSEFKNYLEKRLKTNKSVFEVYETEGEICENVPTSRSSFPNAWVNITFGCNNFCSYCIVPYVRGRERSRDKDEILKEVETLVREGYKEITLLGQNVDSYGKNFENNYDFADLLSDICKIDGKFRVRFMSNYPKDISEKVIKVIAENDKICKCIHLPVQAGSNRILSLMNRRYDREKYLNIVNTLRLYCSDIAITTDIMVGFPTETDEDFLDTMSLVDSVRYDGAFTFVYSRRKGTKADVMEGQVDEEVKKQRIVKLVDRQNEINREKSLEYLGKTVEILVEDFDQKKKMYLGRDDRGRMVYFPSDKDIFGTFVNVKVVKTGGISLIGEIVGE